MLSREMMRCPFKLLLVIASATALLAPVACGSSGTELNPQPLPPSTPEPSGDPAKEDSTGSNDPKAGGIGDADGAVQDGGTDGTADAAPGDQ